MGYDPAEQSAARRQLWTLLDKHPSLRRQISLDDLIAQRPEARNGYGRTDWTSMLREMQAVVRGDAENRSSSTD